MSNILKKKFCVTLILPLIDKKKSPFFPFPFLEEFHLDDVLEVVLVVGSEINQKPFEDEFQRKIHREKDDC